MPNHRSLPAHCPNFIKLQVFRSEFKGRSQWKGSYRFYNNDRPSDYIDVVVNPVGLCCPSQDGQEWWVEPTSMAPQARIVFANAHQRVGPGNEAAPIVHVPKRSTPPRRRDPYFQAVHEYVESLGQLYVSSDYDDYEGSLQMLIDEERANSEPPDYD